MNIDNLQPQINPWEQLSNIVKKLQDPKTDKYASVVPIPFDELKSAFEKVNNIDINTLIAFDKEYSELKELREKPVSKFDVFHYSIAKGECEYINKMLGEVALKALKNSDINYYVAKNYDERKKLAEEAEQTLKDNKDASLLIYDQDDKKFYSYKYDQTPSSIMGPPRGLLYKEVANSEILGNAEQPKYINLTQA
jgi:hypothetical protein